MKRAYGGGRWAWSGEGACVLEEGVKKLLKCASLESHSLSASHSLLPTVWALFIGVPLATGGCPTNLLHTATCCKCWLWWGGADNGASDFGGATTAKGGEEVRKVGPMGIKGI